MKRIRLGLAIVAAFLVLTLSKISAQIQMPEEAPAGFDNRTNGYITQEKFDAFRDSFEEVEDAADGLGPTFNDSGCGNCHSDPVTGGGSIVTETRAGQLVNGNFVEHPGGSVVQSNMIATCSVSKESVLAAEESTPRTSLNTLGDGYIEAIPDQAIVAIARRQPPDMRGLVISVPVLEANNARRVGRFGWKNQHASLTSFSADAYLNEMGITSPLLPVENTADGVDVNACDMNPANPDDDGTDVGQFAEYMRATKVPPRGPISRADDMAGQALFAAIGCATCHTPVFITAPAGTVINGGTFTVPRALGSKIIHPYSDFLLHDVGIPDHIVQNGGIETYDKVRTPPLWGLRERTLLMHDGRSSNVTDAILRHSNQAGESVAAFRSLSEQNKQRLLIFLGSL